MSNLPRVSHSSESRTSNPLTGVEDEDVQQFRNFIQESKSLGCSPEDTSAASTREVVSESFVDALTKEEIYEFRKKLFTYWEKSVKTGEKPKVEEESKMVRHQGSDLKIQNEEAVTSFEDAKSEQPPTTENLHNIGKLIETELRNIRETKLSESDVGKKVGMMRRSENIDFTELKKKAADLPVVTDLKSTLRKRQLPVLRRTDPLEMVLRIYECIDPNSAGTLQLKDSGEATEGSLTPKMSKDHEFRRHLVVEMRIMYGRLVGAPKERTHSIIEESEDESSMSSSVHTRDSTFSSRDPSMISPLGQSLTAYPEDSTGSPRGDDTLASISQTIESSSKSGLVNKPQFNIPEGAKKQSSAESGSSTSTSTARFSDDTLSDISSIPTDTTGVRSSVSSLRDADSLEGSLSRMPPQLQIDDATDDDAFLSLPLPTGDAGTFLTVPQGPGLPSSLDDSSENAEAEDVGNGQHRRERSPKEDENKKPPKRRPN